MRPIMSWPKANMREFPAGYNIYPEIVFDAGGEYIKIDGFHSLKHISPITTGIELSPESIGQLLFHDMQVTFNDKNEYLNIQSMLSGYRPFRNEANLSVEHYPASNYFLKPSHKFRVGDWVRVSDGTNDDAFRVSSIESDKIYYEAGAVTNTYTYVAIATEPFINKIVRVYLRYDSDAIGDHGSQLVFVGVTKDRFSWNDGEATVTIYNLLGDMLNRELTVKTSGTYASLSDGLEITGADGTLSNSFNWSTQTGNGVLADVTIYNDASLGKWEITFSNATNFTVRGPRCEDKAGTTAGDFYDQTNASDSQIKIASGDWSGTPAAGDVLEFYVSVNFEGLTPAECLLALVMDYAEIDTDYIDYSGTLGTDLTYTFDNVYNYQNLVSYVLTMSFNTPLSIAEAIVDVMPHYATFIMQRIDNCKIGLVFFKRYMTEELYTNPADHMRKFIHNGSVKLGNKYQINRFIINYGWDYSKNSCQYSIIFPVGTSLHKTDYLYDNKLEYITVNIPGIYTEAKAEATGEMYLYMYFWGIDEYEYDVGISELENCFVSKRVYFPIGVVGYSNDNYFRIYKSTLNLNNVNYINIKSNRYRDT